MCSPTPLPRCSPVRWPIPSPPRWSPCPRRGSSGGWRNASRTGSAPPGRGDGICAGVAFRSPAALVAESISGAIGGAPDADPWHPERAVWPLLEVLDAAADEPWCAALATHRTSARRHALARRHGGAVRRLRHPPARAAAGLAGRRRRGVDARPGVAARAVAAAARADRRAGSRRAGRRGVRGPARRSRHRRAARAAVAVRPHPARRAGARRARRAGRAPRGAPVAAPPLPRAVGHGRGARHGRGAAARAPTRPPTRPRHPLLSSLGRDVRELQVRLTAAVPGLVDRAPPAAPSRRPRCWAGCSGSCATTGRPP